MEDLGGGSSPETRSMSGLRAAQLRARAVRGALIKIGFGMLFLVGALAHALSPQRHEQTSILWMTALVLLSTMNIAIGLRTLTRVRRLRRGFWPPVAGAWAVLSVVLLGLLLRR